VGGGSDLLEDQQERAQVIHADHLDCAGFQRVGFESGEGCADHNRASLNGGNNPADDAHPVDAGGADVENDDIGTGSPHNLDEVETEGNRRHQLEAGRVEEQRDGTAHSRVIAAHDRS